MKQYFWNILISFWNILIVIDKSVNAILGGDPNETISSRMGKALPRCRMCRLVCKILHPIDNNHCVKSINEDEGALEKWSW